MGKYRIEAETAEEFEKQIRLANEQISLSFLKIGQELGLKINFGISGAFVDQNERLKECNNYIPDFKQFEV